MGAFFVAHVLTFFQLNGQFLYKSFVKYEWAVAAAGVILSFFYMWGTKYVVEAFGGLLCPGRFIGFGVGMVIYAIMVSHFFNEGINLKTLTSLILATGLVCVQISCNKGLIIFIFSKKFVHTLTLLLKLNL
jgi:hypothetical protein